jgi:hypothetical protein
MTKWIAIARNERTGLAENDHGTLMTAKGHDGTAAVSASPGVEN